MPPDLHLVRPLWLLALIPLALVVWRLLRRGASGDVWSSLVDAHLLPHLLVGGAARARRRSLGLLALGWLLGVVALAGPVWERLPQPVYRALAYRVIALDLSPTMNARDLTPSRLARARFKVQDLLKRAVEGQTALLAYGSEPYVVSPLTTDSATIAAQVPSLETSLLPVSGDRRADLALAKAGELLRQGGASNGEVILVTDGLDHPAAALQAARELRREGFSLSVLGVGTSKGAPVPGADGGFLKGASGAILMPKLDRDALAALARAGGGRYVGLTPDDRDVRALIPPEHLHQMRQAKPQDTRSDQWREEGPWLLLALLPIAALGFRRGWLSPLLLLLALSPPRPAQALGWNDLWLRPDQQAAGLMAAGKPADASREFKRPDWRAAAHYQAGDYKQALAALDAVGARASDYNRGNTLARMGRLKDALAAYDRALAGNPEDADARFNRDLVSRLLQQRKRQGPPRASQGRSGQRDASAHQGKGQGTRGKGQAGRQGQAGKQGQAGDAARSPGPQDRSGEAGRTGKDSAHSGAQHRSGAKTAQSEAGTVPSGQQRSGGRSADQGQSQSKQVAGGRPEGRRAHQLGKPRGQGPQAKPGSLAQGGQAQKGTKPDRKQGERQAQGAAQAGRSGASPGEKGAVPPRRHPAPAPGIADLLGGGKRPPGTAAAPAPESTAEREARQATEEMLRRVPDDPGGLLRQRFLLQHLRRTGQLPEAEPPM